MRDEELTQLIEELGSARQRIIGELESFLGVGFKITDNEHIDIELKKGSSDVPFATVLPPKKQDRAIRVLQREAILNAIGLEYIDFRSKYRQIADRLQSLDVGNVVYEK